MKKKEAPKQSKLTLVISPDKITKMKIAALKRGMSVSQFVISLYEDRKKEENDS